MRTRDAILPDAEKIHELISSYSGDGTLLPRNFAEICENVRDFVVLEHRPDHPYLDYQVKVAEIAGLRLIENTLDFFLQSAKNETAL